MMPRGTLRRGLSRGVVGTSIEQVLTASNARRSQLHRYVANKEAVVDVPMNAVLARQQSLPARVDSVRGLREWAMPSWR